MTGTSRLVVLEAGEGLERPPQGEFAIAKVGRDILFNVETLRTFDVEDCGPIHYDLLLLCAAVEFADRRWRRPQGWARSLELEIPVHQLDVWRDRDLSRLLNGLLAHLTGDRWSVFFRPAIDESRLGSQQTKLHLGSETSFAIAYSDGLDSRAVIRLVGSANSALKVRVERNRQSSHSESSPFRRIPFKVRNTGSNEGSFRTRGFIFAAIAAIAARLSGLERVVVPESGQGALGSALAPLYGVYTDYRNHPAFLRQMERFVAGMMGGRVKYEQPRLWSTKGQTLAAYLALDGTSPSDLLQTRSCWQTRFVVNEGHRRQCGLCAACVLRRLSLVAAGVEEPSGTYVVEQLNTRRVGEALSKIHERERARMVGYGYAAVRHFQRLVELYKSPSSIIRGHGAVLSGSLGLTKGQAADGLHQLLEAHTDEWESFLHHLGEGSFMNTWASGGPHAGTA